MINLVDQKKTQKGFKSEKGETREYIGEKKDRGKERRRKEREEIRIEKRRRVGSGSDKLTERIRKIQGKKF